MKFKIVFFDMAGTTVNDEIYKKDCMTSIPLVFSAYIDAFKTAGIILSYKELNECRGKNKREVFKEKIVKYRNDLSIDEQLSLVDILLNKFINHLFENIECIKEMPGTSEVFRYLKTLNAFVAIGSGFPYKVIKEIIEKFGWKTNNLIDYFTCGELVGGGRPKPNMINDVLMAAGYLSKKNDISKPIKDFDYSIVLKIGDTVKDMEEAKNVGAYGLGVMTGTHSKKELENIVGKNKVIQSIQHLPRYLKKNNFV
jgi:phosphoglycolate phosphatase-like HAD superfamily hydrolase